jgi:hypothetical protein
MNDRVPFLGKILVWKLQSSTKRVLSARKRVLSARKMALSARRGECTPLDPPMHGTRTLTAHPSISKMAHKVSYMSN